MLNTGITGDSGRNTWSGISFNYTLYVQTDELVRMIKVARPLELRFERRYYTVIVPGNIWLGPLFALRELMLWKGFPAQQFQSMLGSTVSFLYSSLTVKTAGRLG